MSKKRGAESAGIKIHVKKEDLEYEEMVKEQDRENGQNDEEEEEEEEKERPVVQKVKKVARRSLPQQQQQQLNDESADQPVNPFSAVQFMAASKPAVSAPALKPMAAAAAVQIPASSSSSSSSSSRYRDVAELNKSFLQWFKAKMLEDESAEMSSGVSKYIEYCLQFENGGSIESITNNGNTTLFSAVKPAAFTNLPANVYAISEPAPKTLFDGNLPVTGGLFDNPTPATNGGLFGNNAPATGGLFGNSAPATGGLFGNSAPATGGLFGDSAPATGGLFGNNAPAPGGLFSNNAPAPGSLFSSNTGFSSTLFAGTPTLPAATPSAEPEDGGEEGGDDALEEDEPAVEVIKSSSETEDTLFEAEGAKMSMLAEKEFKPKGEGRIVFLRDKANKAKCQLIVRSPTTGKIFFNAPVNSSMKSSIKLKGRSVLMMTLSFGLNVETNALEAENGGKPGYYRMLLKSEDEAQRLNAALLAAL
ncbi:hypothetical protein BASA81_001576 [Batrachochytrium salamandrivorans]|nr:hypothetical protein BASA81_001576 [Batrachochytrium salamandrivorans]